MKIGFLLKIFILINLIQTINVDTPGPTSNEHKITDKLILYESDELIFLNGAINFLESCIKLTVTKGKATDFAKFLLELLVKFRDFIKDYYFKAKEKVVYIIQGAARSRSQVCQKMAENNIPAEGKVAEDHCSDIKNDRLLCVQQYAKSLEENRKLEDEIKRLKELLESTGKEDGEIEIVQV